MRVNRSFADWKEDGGDAYYRSLNDPRKFRSKRKTREAKIAKAKDSYKSPISAWPLVAAGMEVETIRRRWEDLRFGMKMAREWESGEAEKWRPHTRGLWRANFVKHGGPAGFVKLLKWDVEYAVKHTYGPFCRSAARCFP